MAKLRTFQSLENGENVIRFVMDPSSISSTDKELITKFGEPEVNLGGQILDTDNTTVMMTLPDEWVKVISGLPVKKVIDPSAEPWDTDTADKLTQYRVRIQERFVAAFTTLRGTADSYTNEYITQI